MKMKQSVVCLLVALISAPALGDNKGKPDDRNDHLFDKSNAQVYGKKTSEWSAEWWQYILSTPQNPNPLFDTTGGYRTIVQHGPVWLLEGAIRGAGGIERQFSIPDGRSQ